MKKGVGHMVLAPDFGGIAKRIKQLKIILEPCMHRRISIVVDNFFGGE
jgi:hypothetical protein